MKRKLLLYSLLAASAGIGCSLFASYDGFSDGVAADDGGIDATTIGDAEPTFDGGGGDSSAGDAASDKKYAIVILGGEVFTDAGASVSMANVEYAMINSDGSLGPWSTTTSLPAPEDSTGAVAWGSSVFVMDDFGAAVAVMQPGGGLSSSWTVLANVNRNTPRLAAVDGRLYVASGTAPGGAAAPEVYVATITGPQSIGSWTPTTGLSLVDGGPRNDSTLLANDKTLYLVGGDHLNVDITSIVSAPIDSTGAVGQWAENTPLPTPGDLVRGTFARGHLTLVGGSLGAAGDRNVYSSLVQVDGVLGAWQQASQHPATSEPLFVAHADFVYLIGGTVGVDLDTAVVHYAPIEATGFPGVWQTTSSINVPRHNGTAVVVAVP